MSRATGSTKTILLAVVTAVALVEAIVLFGMEARVADLEDRAGRSPAAEGDDRSPLALGSQMAEQEQRLADLSRTVDGVSRLAEGNAARIEEVSRTAEGLDLRVRAGVGSGGSGTAVSPETLDEAVSRAVEEKLASMPRGEGEWKPSLEEFREYLGLSDSQIRRAEEIFDDAKHDAFLLLGTRRPDGTAFVDDLVAALKDPDDPEAAMKKTFVRLFSERIPGRDEPYIAEILRIKEKADSALASMLDGEQRAKLSKVTLDHLGVKTAYDPFAEYLQESLR